MKQIVDKLNKIAKKINENVELSDRDLIIDSLDSITKAYGGTPNDSNLIVDKLEDIYNNISPAVSGNIEITENGENINVAPYATATVNVSGGGGFPTCEITLVPQVGGSIFYGYNAEHANYCLDTNGQLMATINNYETNLVVNALYAPVGGSTVIAYNNSNDYATEADALASVTDKVNITVVTFEDNGRYYVGIMPTDDTLPSSCTMTGNGK